MCIIVVSFYIRKEEITGPSKPLFRTIYRAQKVLVTSLEYILRASGNRITQSLQRTRVMDPYDDHPGLAGASQLVKTLADDPSVRCYGNRPMHPDAQW